jgi:high-affinity iron transporter
MIAPSRFPAWLFVPLLALCSSNLLADTVEGAPQALHLLDYIGADYPATVRAGRSLTNLNTANSSNSPGCCKGWSPPCRASRKSRAGAGHQCAACGDHGASGRRGGRPSGPATGRETGCGLRGQPGPGHYPRPDPRRALYAQHCSVCHGDAGAGDGPAGVGLTRHRPICAMLRAWIN